MLTTERYYCPLEFESDGGGGAPSGTATNWLSIFLQVALSVPWGVVTSTAAPSLLPLQASNASLGGFLLSPGGFCESAADHARFGTMAVSSQIIRTLFKMFFRMLFSFLTICDRI